MGDEAFNEDLLTEKLSKLNSSQQSIESVSRWCISHRNKAKQVVETWDKLFTAARQEQRVSFLYLANDILQNSRRKGNEFVNEFWKVLPTALKAVYDSAGESGKKVASRLVTIWEERKVFGSRGQNLKNDVLGKGSFPSKNPSPVTNIRNLNSVKVVKRDANSLRIKLAVGGLPEKIITAFQSVHDEIASEEVALNKCRNIVSCVRELEKDIFNLSSQGNLPGSDLMDNIQKQETELQKCISQLEKFEAIRVALLTQLREALQDQESKLEQIQSELLVARGQTEQAANTRLHLTSSSSVPPVTNQVVAETSFPTPPSTNIPSMSSPTTHSFTSTPFLNPTISEEESKKAAAAAVAAKLTASMSSAQMLTSVLSSLVAEEAASVSSGLNRPKLETLESSSHPSATQTNLPPGAQLKQLQTPFLTPPLPPRASTMMGLPYGYAGNNLLPPAFAMAGLPPQQAQPQQQQPANGGYYRPVSAGFYGQSHQPPTPPINRQ